MTRRIASAILLAVLTATAALAQREGSVWWGYYQGDEVPSNYLGVSKATVYEAAVHVNGLDAPLKGGTISAVRLPFRDVEHIDSLTLWIATELGQQELASVFVGKPQPGWNVIQLPADVSVPAEGIYVGYTFRVTELDGKSERPLIICSNYDEGGLWLRVADVKAYSEWTTTKRYGSLALQLATENPSFPACFATLDAIRQNNVVRLTADSVEVMFSSYGTEAVHSLQYRYEFGDEEKTGSYELKEPLPRVYGYQAYDVLPIMAPEETGRLPLTLTLTGVNGKTIEGSGSQQAEVLSLQHSTHHRTVMEEYTGTWCSACPRGFAGIARLKQLFPDDFIAVSVHILNGDPMDVYYDYYYVMNTTQFPSCRFDRGALTDPYDGDVTDGHFHADQNFRTANAIKAPANLSVSAQWTTDSVCSIESSTTFAFDDDECRYQLAYIMIEDSLCGPDDDHSWHQKNSFNDPSMAYYVEDDMQQYVNAEGMMLHGMKYNDVVIAMSDVRGIDGSLSGRQACGVPMTHSYELRRSPVSQHRENVHIVCLLIDKLTKRVANAAICPVTTSAAVQYVAVSQQRAERAYDLQGRPAAKRQKGLVIVRNADGTIRKQIIK